MLPFNWKSKKLCLFYSHVWLQAHVSLYTVQLIHPFSLSLSLNFFPLISSLVSLLSPLSEIVKYFARLLGATTASRKRKNRMTMMKQRLPIPSLVLGPRQIAQISLSLSNLHLKTHEKWQKINPTDNRSTWKLQFDECFGRLRVLLFSTRRLRVGWRVQAKPNPCSPLVKGNQSPSNHNTNN